MDKYIAQLSSKNSITYLNKVFVIELNIIKFLAEKSFFLDPANSINPNKLKSPQQKNYMKSVSLCWCLLYTLQKKGFRDAK